MPQLTSILKQMKKYPLNEYSDRVVKFLIDKWQKEDSQATESVITQLIKKFEQIKDGLPAKVKQVAIPDRFKENKQQYLDITQYSFEELVKLLKSLPKDDEKTKKEIIKYFVEKEHLDKPVVQSYVNRFVAQKRDLKYKVDNGDDDNGFSKDDVRKLIPPELLRNDLYLDISNWRSFVKLEQLMDALFPREIQAGVEGEETNTATTEADKVYDKDSIEVYRGDAQHKCVSYNPTVGTRKKYSWCIAQPGNSNYDYYRFQNGNNRMFYFVFDRTKGDTNNFHAFVIHVGEGNKKYWVTDSRNSGDHGENNWDGVIRYIASNDKTLAKKLEPLEKVFKYIAPSKAEISAAALRGKELTKQDFRELDDDTKVQYIQSNTNKPFLKNNGILDILSNEMKNLAINYGQEFSWNELKNSEALARRYAIFRFRHTNYSKTPIALPYLKYLDEPAKMKYFEEFSKKYTNFEQIEKYFGDDITKFYVNNEVKNLGYLPDSAAKYIRDPNEKEIFEIYSKLFQNWVVSPTDNDEDASSAKNQTVRPISLSQADWKKLDDKEQKVIIELTKKYSNSNTESGGAYEALLYGAPFVINGHSKDDLLVLPIDGETNDEFVITDSKGNNVIKGTHKDIKLGNTDAESGFTYKKYYDMKEVKVDGKPLTLNESKIDDWVKYNFQRKAGIIK